MFFNRRWAWPSGNQSTLKSFFALFACSIFLSVVAAAEPQNPATNSATISKTVSNQPSLALPDFQIKKGFRIELVADDSLIQAPAAMAFDDNGRLYVAELREDQPGAAENAHRGRIRLLEDTNGDGTFDTSRVFATNLASPSALACYGGGLFVAARSEIIYLKSSSGNGTADVRQVVFSGFGTSSNSTEPANSGQSQPLLNNFNWALDNRIHGVAAGLGGIITNAANPSLGLMSLAGSDFSFDPRTFSLSPEAGPAQSGLSFDNAGRKFVSNPGRPLRLVMYEPRYFSRNPFAPKPPLMIDIASPSTLVYRFFWPSGQATSTNSPATVHLVPAWLTNACGLAIYRGDLFPSNYLENAFIADTEAPLIHREVLRNAGTAVAGSRAPDEQGTEFLVSRDELFRPVQIINGPEGGLYIADKRDTENSGRIYRIVPENFKQPKPPQLAAARTYDLVTNLASANGWVRDTAARLLYEHGDPAATLLLSNMLFNSKLPLARLHALHALDGLGAVNESMLLRALRDPDERIREHAIALADKGAATAPTPNAGAAAPGPFSQALWQQLLALVNDPSPRVRYQLAFTLGQFSDPAKPQALPAIVSRDFGNPWLRGAVVSSLSQGGTEVLTNLYARSISNSVGEKFLEQLATVLGLQGNVEQEINPLLDFFEQAPLEQPQLFRILASLGEGLRRNRSSLALVDKQGVLLPLYSKAMQTALDRNNQESLRLDAFQLLKVSPYTLESSADLFLLMLGSGESQTIQTAALELLGRYVNRQIGASLIARYGSLPQSLRPVLISALLERNDRVPLVLTAVQEGKISPKDFSSVQMDFLRTRTELGTRQQAIHLFGVPHPRKPSVVLKFLPALSQRGDPSRGKEIFRARCSACHLVGGEGHRVGPDLAEWKRLGTEKMLLAIIEPDVEVRKGFETSTVLTRDGENVTGVITDENLTTVTLNRPNEDGLVLPRANIDSIEKQNWSLMPEGLQEGLSLQGMADLLEFIMATPR